MFINIPEKSLYVTFKQELEQALGAETKRRFVGFRAETGRSPVTIINTSNVKYVALQAARTLKTNGSLVEIFTNNTAWWEPITK